MHADSDIAALFWFNVRQSSTFPLRFRGHLII